MLQIAVATFLIWLLFGIICRSARKWWFYFWLASIPLTIFMMFVEPVLIDPLFNKFEPLSLRRPDLVAQLGQVAKRGRLPVPESRMFEMNASEKVTSINAYVAGIGASKRIVVWDTTIAHLSTPEILFVFGHEMGHYVLRHIPKGMALSAAGMFLGLYFVFLAMNRLLANRGPQWKVRGPDDLASLPLLLLLSAILSFVGSPMENGISRYFEHQADIYGLEVIHGIVPDPQTVAVQSFQRLGEIDLSDPNPSPFIKIWLFSHPPITERIEFARSYDPWSKGQAPQFVK